MKSQNQFLAIFIIAVFTLIQSVSAQEIPAFLFPVDHYLISGKAATDQNLYNAFLNYEDQIKQVSNNFNNVIPDKTDTLINGKRVIPVVFHIIHKAGAENITDAQIFDAVERLNIDYNLQNTDTAETYYMFKDRAANCNIEFRLAKIDPWGNCTDGINRMYDPGTNYAYFHTMTKYAWSPSRYMNIFVVNFIYPEGMALPDGAFIGGMSPFPPSNPLSQALTGGDTLADGVLIRHDCIGSIGTAENMAGMPINALNRTFTHETGHYFNLYHPFQNLMFGLLPAASGCHTFLAPNGDYVDDTPQVATPNQNTSIQCIVPGSVNSCTDAEPDMVENYMDYQWGYCQNIFTIGQYDRMDATLTSDRIKLWSAENLIYTGVLDTNTYICAPVPDFYSNKTMLCAGGNVQFSDYSWSGQADTYLWTFNGGTPSSSNDHNPVITYNNPGIYPVTMELTNSAGTNTLTKQGMIHVFDPAVAYSTPAAESFETININEFVTVNDTGSVWEINSGTAYTGSKCLYLNNFTGNVAGSMTEIITPGYDFTDFVVPPLPSLKFKLAYSGKYVPGSVLTAADTIYDQLKVFVSKDCGATWTEKYSKKGTNLTTTSPVETAFSPTDLSQWREETIVLTGGGGFAGQPNVKFKFQFYSNGGNNIYIDDLNIDYLNASIEEVIPMLNLKIYPNPASDVAALSFTTNTVEQTTIRCLDLTGRCIFETDAGELLPGSHQMNLDISNIQSGGIYIIIVSTEHYTVSSKLTLIR